MSKNSSTTISTAESTANSMAKPTYCEDARVTKNSENSGTAANGATVQRDAADTTAVAPPVVPDALTIANDATAQRGVAVGTVASVLAPVNNPVANAAPLLLLGSDGNDAPSAERAERAERAARLLVYKTNKRVRKERKMASRLAKANDIAMRKAVIERRKNLQLTLEGQEKHAAAADAANILQTETILKGIHDASVAARPEEVTKKLNQLEKKNAILIKTGKKMKKDYDKLLLLKKNLFNELNAAHGEDAVVKVEPAKDTNMSRRTETSCKQASARIQQSRKAKATKAKAENNPTKVMRRSTRTRATKKK